MQKVLNKYKEGRPSVSPPLFALVYIDQLPATLLAVA